MDGNCLRKDVFLKDILLKLCKGIHNFQYLSGKLEEPWFIGLKKSKTQIKEWNTAKKEINKYFKSSFKDGSKIILDNSSLSRSNSRNYQDFFPKSFLKKQGVAHRNLIINITYINQGLNIKEIKDKSPTNYINKFSKSIPDFDKTLKSHLIDDLKDFGVLSDNYYRVLDKRTDRIFSELQKKYLKIFNTIPAISLIKILEKL